MRFALLTLALAGLATADAPPAVMNTVREAAEALSDDNLDRFLQLFNPGMPNRVELRQNVDGLLARYEVASAVEEIGSEGDANSQTLELDWLLSLSEKGAVNGRNVTRRERVKCRLEKKGKDWRFASIAPLTFFQP